MSKQMNRRFSHGKEKGAARGDDRNLVLVDEDFQDADFEDRVWLYWQRHGRKTIAGATALFVAIIAAIVWVESGKMRTASLQAEYASAETPEAKLAFARANEGHPIAGTAYFAAGREFSEAGKYAEAADAFGNAGRVFAALEDFSAMRDRATVSEAVVRARAGTEGAEENAFALLKSSRERPARIRSAAGRRCTSSRRRRSLREISPRRGCGSTRWTVRSIRRISGRCARAR